MDSTEVSGASWGWRGVRRWDEAPTRCPSEATLNSPHLLPGCAEPPGTGESGQLLTTQCATPDHNTAAWLTHSHTEHTHARAHRCKGCSVAVGGGLFFCLFCCCVLFVCLFSYSHYKRPGQGPVELTKELTNITKILQSVKMSSTHSAFMNEMGGTQAEWGGQGSEGLASSTSSAESLGCSVLFCFVFCFLPHPCEMRSCCYKYCVLGFTDPLRASSPLPPRWGRSHSASRVCTGRASPGRCHSSHYKHNCSSHRARVSLSCP